MDKLFSKYFLFLRGVNVGGKNKVSMPLLKAALEKVGFSNVITYINSGNIIFTSNDDDIIGLQKVCKQIIKDNFDLDIVLAIISFDDLKEAIDNAPSWWDENKDFKNNAIIVIPPKDSSEIMSDIGEIKPEYEKVDFYRQVIFWSAPVDTFSRTRYAKIVSSSSYEHVTIRNANTIKKVIELAKKI